MTDPEIESLADAIVRKFPLYFGLVKDQPVKTASAPAADEPDASLFEQLPE